MRPRLARYFITPLICIIGVFQQTAVVTAAPQIDVESLSAVISPLQKIISEIGQLLAGMEVNAQVAPAQMTNTGTTGSKRVLVLRLRYNDTPASSALTATELTQFQGALNQFKEFYNTTSGGKMTISTIDVKGPYTIPRKLADGPPDAAFMGYASFGNLYKWQTADHDNVGVGEGYPRGGGEIDQILCDRGIDLSAYDHIVVSYELAAYEHWINQAVFANSVYEGNIGLRGAGIIALIDFEVLDCADRTKYKTTSVRPLFLMFSKDQLQTSQDRRAFSHISDLLGVLSHEFGHNLHWGHAGSMYTYIAPDASVGLPKGAPGYGNLVDVMGSGYLGLHPNVIYQLNAKWANTDAIQSMHYSGQFTLRPTETSGDGIKALIVGNDIYEFRYPLQFDNTYAMREYLSGLYKLQTLDAGSDYKQADYGTVIQYVKSGYSFINTSILRVGECHYGSGYAIKVTGIDKGANPVIRGEVRFRSDASYKDPCGSSDTTLPPDPPRADLVVGNIDVQGAYGDLKVGEPFTVRFDVSNIGSEMTFVGPSILVRIPGPDGKVMAQTLTAPLMPPGQIYFGELDFPAFSFPSETYSVIVRVDSNTAVTERNESNNSASANYFFSTDRYPLYAAIDGSGLGTVNITNIDPETSFNNNKTQLNKDNKTETYLYDKNTKVTLTATPLNADYKFRGWTGACAHAQRTCVITMDAAQDVVAEFIKATVNLEIERNSSYGITWRTGQTVAGGATITVRRKDGVTSSHVADFSTGIYTLRVPTESTIEIKATLPSADQAYASIKLDGACKAEATGAPFVTCTITDIMDGKEIDAFFYYKTVNIYIENHGPDWEEMSASLFSTKQPPLYQERVIDCGYAYPPCGTIILRVNEGSDILIKSMVDLGDTPGWGGDCKSDVPKASCGFFKVRQHENRFTGCRNLGYHYCVDMYWDYSADEGLHTYTIVAPKATTSEASIFASQSTSSATTTSLITSAQQLALQSSGSKPDLVIRSTQMQPKNITLGSSVEFAGVIGNEGQGASTKSAEVGLRVYKGGSATPMWSFTNYVPPLQPGKQHTAQWLRDSQMFPAIQFFSGGSYRLELCADPLNQIAEANETNNCSSISTGGSFYAIDVSRVGTGEGFVRSSNGAIACGGTCSATVGNTTLILEALAAANSNFVGWEGSDASRCALSNGNATCSIASNEDIQLSARFRLKNSTPGDVNRDGKVAATDALMALNLSIGLPVAGADAMNADINKDGAISATDALMILKVSTGLPLSAISVSPTNLSTTITGTGSGAVTPSLRTVSGVTTIELKPVASAGSQFGGWSGACTGTGSCMISEGKTANVTARFTANANQFVTVSVSKSGIGSGKVVSTGKSGTTPVDCGSKCSTSTVLDSYLLLMAYPSDGSTFVGFSGADASVCSKVFGSHTCYLKIDRARSMTAVFSKP